MTSSPFNPGGLARLAPELELVEAMNTCGGRAKLRHRTALVQQRCGVLQLLTALLLLAGSAQAVIVRGSVRDISGRPVPGARIQLVAGQATATFALAGGDGSFELRDGDAGRFLLLTSASGYVPQIGLEFYSGSTDVVLRDVVLSLTELRTPLARTSTRVPTAFPQLTDAVSLVSRDNLSTRVGPGAELPLRPGTFYLQKGQLGSPATLSVWGGAPDANLVMLDGASATDLGGSFDFAPVSSTGLAVPGAGPSMELYRGANSATYGTGALAGVVALETARGSGERPALNYSGDAGNFHTWRNEVIVSGARGKLDYLAGFSRFDTSNALPQDRFHAATAVADLGYSLTARTSLRITVRNADDAVGVPGPYDFYALAAQGKQADQDLYGTVIVENTTLRRWHNLAQYGLVRKREQVEAFSPVGTLLPASQNVFGHDVYLGKTVEIRGANGSTVTGQAVFFQPSGQTANNRDEFTYQSDFSPSELFKAFIAFRYADERGLLAGTTQQARVDRSNYDFSGGLQGTVRARISYALTGSVEDNAIFGVKGTPRFGLAYQLIRPSSRPFQGSRFRVNTSTGVQEPSTAAQLGSLYQQLMLAGEEAKGSRFGVPPLMASRSRMLSFGIDQNILGEKITLHAGVFHNQFSHGLEEVNEAVLNRTFGLDLTGAGISAAVLNTFAYRAEGIDAEVDLQPRPRLLFRIGYTYMETRVEQSLAASAQTAQQGNPTLHLADPVIGTDSPLLGARAFREPPHLGFAVAQYTGQRLSLVATASVASRADDSTFLAEADRNGGDSLLLPNRDLDFGFIRIDLGGTYAASKRLTLFVQSENLANDQHIGPIGYPGIPLTVRGGVKLRLGGY